MGKKYYIILGLLFLILMPVIFAETEGQIPLLALLTKEKTDAGLIAKLDLKIIEGNEKVFLQTFPMTQVSTQVSMRFAQQIACNELELNCSGKDFLYTITAVPGIIGGPSAGAAGAVLTTALLMNETINQEIAITGTINSGGLVGPVGGIREKIQAAAKNGIQEVLIPLGTAIYPIDENLSLNLIELGKELNISVREVATLSEAVEIITGAKTKKKTAVMKIDEKYLEKMKDISNKLCARTTQLNEIFHDKVDDFFINKSKKAFDKDDYYSAASYCFRQNVLLQKNIFSRKTEKEIDLDLEKLEFVIKKQEEQILEKQIRTLTDIETYMAVMERLEEAKNLVEEARNSENKADMAALATERLYSANTWAEFFDLTYDTRIQINEEKIKQSCSAKISEAEERYSYAKILFKAQNLGKIKDAIESAYSSTNKGDHIMCLYKASKAKADSDVLLAWYGVSNEDFLRIMNVKLDAAKEAIARILSKGVFPIIAYSYYEYSQNLLYSEDPVSALFAEYALELSSIDLYFKLPSQSKIEVIKGEQLEKQRKKQEYLWKVMATGFFILLIILAIVFYEIGSRKRDKKLKAMMRKKRKRK